MENDRSREAWIYGGTLAALAALAYSALRGNRRLGRLTSGFAGAFLEEFGELRLEKRVAGLLAKARAQGLTPGGDLGRPRGNP